MVVLFALLIGNLWVWQNNERLTSQDPSFQERLEQNMISRNMLVSQPFGVGAQRFTLEMELYSGRGPIEDPVEDPVEETITRSIGSSTGPSVGINKPSIKLLPWEFQPVHNTYFLIANETGVQGILLLLIALVVLFYRYWKKGSVIPLLVILLIMPFDHFWWDSFTGLMLVGITLGFFGLQQR